MNERQLYHNPITLLLVGMLLIGLGITNLSYAAPDAADQVAPQVSPQISPEVKATCKAPSLTSTRTPPDIRINGDNLESRLSSMMVSANTPITIDYLPRDLSVPLLINTSAGRLVQVNEVRWQLWPAPEQTTQVQLCAGDFYSRLQLMAGVHKAQMRLSYPSPRQSPSPQDYQQPETFIEVASAANSQLDLSPHFQLWQFLPKARAAKAKRWPQYTLISLALLEKLELVMAVLAEHNRAVPTLHILSGYRSPAHNRRVGGAVYSRHQYGDAVDFIVDGNNDGKMDDLNEDGVVDRLDLDWLTDRLARRSVPVSAGGTGTYESAGPAAAFIHLDARGRDHYWQ